LYRIDNQAHVADNKYLSLLTHYSAFWWQAAYGVSVLLNMLILFSTNADGIENRWYHLWQWIHAPLGMLHLVLWCLSTLEFYFIQFPILVNRRHVTPDEEGVWVLTSSHFWASVTESRFWYHIMMVVFSVMGLFYPAFYSLHLLDFAYRDSTLQGVIASITLNVNSMTRTVKYCFIFGKMFFFLKNNNNDPSLFFYT
jgi:hypothetical protein